MAMSPLTVFSSQSHFSYSPSPAFSEILEEGSSCDHIDATKAAASSFVKPTAVFKSVESAQPSSKALESEKISVFDVNHQYARTATKTIKAWKEYIEERVGQTRYALSSFNEKYSETTDKDVELQRLDLRQKVTEDLKAKDSYKEVINRILSDVEAISKKSSTVMVRVLLDQHQNIQAMASYSMKKDHLYVNLLATAPSNLRLHGQNLDTHQSFKGGGTIILHSLYVSAQKEKLPRLMLSPLDGSVSFYQYIGMKLESNPEEKQEHFYLDVEQDQLPSEFEKQFNRLCFNLLPPDRTT